MKIWISRLCLCLFFISILAACSDNSSVDPQLENKYVDRIIYFSDADRGTQAQVMTPDGKDLSPIQFNVPAGIRIGELQWSKTAQRWAFMGLGQGPTDIYISSPDGKDVKNVTNLSGYMTADGPVFSPDGKRIAYTVAEGSKNTAVATSLIDGTNINRVSKDPLIESSPAWLSDNNHLVLFSSRSGSPNIYKGSIDGSPLINLSKGPGLDTDLSLAENGSIFVFLSDRARGKNLFAYDLKTDKITQITQDLGIIYSPKSSPDGSKVIFRAEKNGDSDLFLYDFNNKSTTQLTHTPKVRQQDISWAADSQKVLFSSDVQGKRQIFLMDLTGKITQLTNRSSNSYGPMWIRILP